MSDHGEVDSWAEDYLLRREMGKALKSKEADDFPKKLAEVPAEPHPPTPQAPPAESVTCYFAERPFRLRQSVESFRRELKARRDLHERFLEGIDYQISRA